jgi:hypothetical protein
MAHSIHRTQLLDRLPDHESVRYMIHHVFLPPKVPQTDDSVAGLDSSLASMVLKSLREFNSLQGCNSATDTVTSMVENFRAIHHESGTIVEAKLKEILIKLSSNSKSH